MITYAVSFFGHRQIDNVFTIEEHLETIIRELLLSKEYVEFLIGRDGMNIPSFRSRVSGV